MKNIVRKFLVVLAIAPIAQAMAGITVIDFDNDSAGTAIGHGRIVDTQYQSVGVTINSVNEARGNLEGRQVAFDTTLPISTTEDSDLEYYNPANDYENGSSTYGNDYKYTALVIEGHSFGNTPGNVLILQENDTGCSDNVCDLPDDEGSRPAGYFEFNFDFLVDIISLDTFDFEESTLLTAQFFDQNDVEITTSFAFTAMINGGFLRQDIGVNGVKRLVLNLPGSGAIDNLVIKTNEIPEPSGIALISLGALFYMRRVKK